MFYNEFMGSKKLKEVWEERVCIFCSSGKVETEKHFILDCEAFKDEIKLCTYSSS